MLKSKALDFVIGFSYRIALFYLGLIQRSFIDAILTSLLVLCIIAYRHKASAKFWNYHPYDSEDYISDTENTKRLSINWEHLGRGALFTSWFLAIAFACYYTGRWMGKDLGF
jgi:hypothetical protein